MKETLKKAAFVIMVLFVGVMTLVPVSTLWGLSFYQKAGDECYDVDVITSNIYEYEQSGTDEMYYDVLLKELKR